MLRGQDLTGGVLNNEAIKILRKVQSPEKYGRTLLPSEAELARTAIIVENYAMRGVCPLGWYKDDNGSEIIRFEPSDVLKCALKGSGLWEEARVQPVKIAQAFDGSQLLKTLSHTLAGFMMGDRDVNLSIAQ